jgi:hypothetical protein
VPNQTRNQCSNQREAIKKWALQAPPRSAPQSSEHAPAAAPQQQQQQQQQHPRNSNRFRFAPLAKNEKAQTRTSSPLPQRSSMRRPPPPQAGARQRGSRCGPLVWAHLTKDY